MPSAPAAGVVVTADYTYGYQVRFSEDVPVNVRPRWP